MLILPAEQAEAISIQVDRISANGDEVSAALMGPMMAIIATDYEIDHDNFHDLQDVSDLKEMIIVLPDGQLITGN